jgi:uncharacterized protein YndB with AHSA1/START domain
MGDQPDPPGRIDQLEIKSENHFGYVLIGHKFQFAGRTEDKTYLHLCEVTQVEPNKKIQYSWRYEGYDGISLVTFEFFAEGENTRVKLTHDGLESFPADNPDFGKKKFNEGWNSILYEALKAYVEKNPT